MSEETESSNGERRGSARESTRSVSFDDENTALLRSNSIDSDVNQSNRSTGSSSGEGHFGFSSHWFDTADADRKEEFRSERDRAVDRGITRAAFLIRDAMLGESENPAQGTYDPYLHPENRYQNLFSLIFRQILATRLQRQTTIVMVWVLGLLTFIEPPRWCSEGFNGDKTINCHVLFNRTGPPAGDDMSDKSVEYYPNSHSLYLYQYQSNIIEWICLSYMIFISLCGMGRDGCSIFRYLRRGPAQLIRICQLLAILLLVVGLCSRQMVLQPFARLLLLSTVTPSVRQEAKALVKIVPEVMNILVILLIFMMFWAFLGTVLFYSTDEGNDDFSSFIESLWTLWICVTTANYPDVMMDFYNESRLTAIYFVVFMILSFFFLMNLILASVVNTYDDVMESRKKKRREKEDAKLTEAFKLMDYNDSGTIDRETIMTLFKILNKDFPEFRHISSRDAKLFYAVLDRNGSSMVDVEEFRDFGSILLLEFFTASEFETFVQQRFPDLYNSASYQHFLQFVKSKKFDNVIDIILVMNAVVVTIQSWPLLVGNPVEFNKRFMECYTDGSIDTYWELIETVFTIIYCIEALLKIIALGWRRYIESTRNAFDFIVTVLALLASVYVYYPNDFNNSLLIRYIVMARVLRLARIIIALKPFRLIGEIWYEIMPYARSVICFLFFVMYFFAALGMELYGGMVSRDPDNPLSYLILNTDFSENDYWANNFNDIISAFNVLFNLLVVNNWTECEVGFEAVTQHRWVRLYFLAFHFAGVILVNNLVIAFFINAFLQQKEILAKRKDQVTVDGEATIHGREAKFDASQVTGTRTNLSGGFVARIRTNHAEEDEQDRLRRLFTQTSDNLRYKEKEHEDALPFTRA